MKRWLNYVKVRWEKNFIYDRGILCGIHYPFVLFNNVPGDRALNQVQNLRGKVSDETFQLRYQEAREKLGLDDPIPVRYVKWMGNLLKGDLGYSSFYKKM